MLSGKCERLAVLLKAVMGARLQFDENLLMVARFCVALVGKEVSLGGGRDVSINNNAPEYCRACASRTLLARWRVLCLTPEMGRTKLSPTLALTIRRRSTCVMVLTRSLAAILYIPLAVYTTRLNLAASNILAELAQSVLATQRWPESRGLVEVVRSVALRIECADRRV